MSLKCIKQHPWVRGDRYDGLLLVHLTHNPKGDRNNSLLLLLRCLRRAIRRRTIS
ncbi:hypothetical protein [Nostoc sp.]|uniref:hypothetical protein n=1 Tax=Nostoc sp. TaxID=1180 RepID=UPI002FFAB2E8